MILSGLFPQLTGVNRPVALAQANAFLNRIDLLSEVFLHIVSLSLLACLYIFLCKTRNTIHFPVECNIHKLSCEVSLVVALTWKLSKNLFSDSWSIAVWNPSFQISSCNLFKICFWLNDWITACYSKLSAFLVL